MKKKMVIFTVIVFVFGILVGGTVQELRKSSVNKIFDYKSSSPMLFTINEKEMNERNELLALFGQYGKSDPDTDAADIQVLPKTQKELLELIPEGSVVEYCKQFQGDIEIRYELNGIFYCLEYTKMHVMKIVELEYNNKEFECHRRK